MSKFFSNNSYSSQFPSISVKKMNETKVRTEIEAEKCVLVQQKKSQSNERQTELASHDVNLLQLM